MFVAQAPNGGEFVASEAVIERQKDGLEPEFRFMLGCFNVNMRRFLAFVALKEEAKTFDSQHGRHCFNFIWFALRG